MSKPILIVQGGQWGSEGKGLVAGALCLNRGVEWAVRTGAVNAGHTVYHEGKVYKMQQLPVGWINPGTKLVLGAGAYIHPEQLADELYIIRNAGYRRPVYIDYRAGLHLPEHTERAGLSGRHYSIGATGKGCSEAILDRIRLRGKGGMLFKDWYEEHYGALKATDWELCDTAKLLNDAYDRGEQILLEGTQGTLLDLYLGPYPYTTHKQCTAAQWVVEAGLSPNLQYETILVVRTYPIRVAGNSGPMPGEITWPRLAIEINDKLHTAGKKRLVDPDAISAFVVAFEKLEDQYASENVMLSERNRDALHSLSPAQQTELGKLFEYTTVTRKLRRIARLDLDSLKYSVMLNRPTAICLSFINYEFPTTWGSTQRSPQNHGFMEILEYIAGLQKSLGVPVSYLTTGPLSENFIDLRHGTTNDLR